MADYLKIARAALALSIPSEPAEAEASVPSPEIEAGPELAEAPSPERSLKGRAVELWCDSAGGRVFVVADEEDAQETIRRFGARRGEVWTPGEIELVARIEDQAIRDEVAGFKRQIGACISHNVAGEGVSPEEWKAAMLNRLCQEQGVTGQPGHVTAETVRHGERKAGAKPL